MKKNLEILDYEDNNEDGTPKTTTTGVRFTRFKTSENGTIKWMSFFDTKAAMELIKMNKQTVCLEVVEQGNFSNIKKLYGPAEEGLETAPVPAAAPVDAPVETEKPGEVKKNERNPYDKDPAGLAVDIYGYLDQSIPVVERMEIAVKLVEQAKEAFE